MKISGDASHGHWQPEPATSSSSLVLFTPLLEPARETKAAGWNAQIRFKELALTVLRVGTSKVFMGYAGSLEDRDKLKPSHHTDSGFYLACRKRVRIYSIQAFN